MKTDGIPLIKKIIINKQDFKCDEMIEALIGFIQECGVVFKFDGFSHLIG